MLHHLLEVVLGELVRDPQQVSAGMGVGEGPDAEAVTRVKLSLEKLAANILTIIIIRRLYIFSCSKGALEHRSTFNLLLL